MEAARVRDLTILWDLCCLEHHPREFLAYHRSSAYDPDAHTSQHGACVDGFFLDMAIIPPFPHFRIRFHLLHIRVIVVTDVLHRSEQSHRLVVQEDGVVDNVTVLDLL